MAKRGLFNLNDENLIPMNKRSKKEVRRIAAKGGRGNKNNPKSKNAAKLRCIKQKLYDGRFKDADEKWLLQRVTDPEAMNLDILKFIDEIRKDVHPAQRVALANAYNNIQKTIHGEKIKSENLNINVNATVDEWEKRLAGKMKGLRRNKTK